MPGPDPEEQRRLQEIEAARTSELFFSAGMQTAAPGISLAGHTAGGLIGQQGLGGATSTRSEEHTSELQSLMRISYAVFCLKNNTNSLTYRDNRIHTMDQ